MPNLQQHVDLLDKRKTEAKRDTPEILAEVYPALIEVAISGDLDELRAASRELYLEFMDSNRDVLAEIADNAADYAHSVSKRVNRG